jgi:hypothetical protein
MDRELAFPASSARVNNAEPCMSVQIVMDHTGDTRHFFDADDAVALAKAEERFKQLTGRGFTAAVRTGPGEVTKVTSFNPAAKETVFFPRLVGG